MRKFAAFALPFLFLACGEREPAPPGFALREVVAERLAELGAQPAPGARSATAPGAPSVAPGAGAGAGASAGAMAGAGNPTAAVEPPPEIPEDLPGLLETLASPRSTMRDVALADLRARGESLAAPLARIAVGALPGDEWTEARRAAAIEALVALDTQASIEPVVRLLTEDRSPWIRAQCAWRLGDSKQDRFLPRILLRLRYESDDEVAVWLGVALAKRGNLSGLDGIRVVRDRAKTTELAELAATELARISTELGGSSGESLIADWASGTYESTHASPEPSRELLLETWRNIESLGAWDLRVVDDRRFALSRSGAWVVPLLAEALHEKSVYVRVHAAQCLERMGPRAAAAGPALQAALGEPRLAAAAAAALGAIRFPAARPALEEGLQSRDPEIAAASARALGALALDGGREGGREGRREGESRAGSRDSVAALRGAFAPNRPADVRQAAAEALLACGEEDVAADLVEWLTAPLAENVSAELALEAWLARRAAAGDPTFVEALAKWRALDPLADAPREAIATQQQMSQRLAARARLAATLVTTAVTTGRSTGAAPGPAAGAAPGLRSTQPVTDSR